MKKYFVIAAILLLAGACAKTPTQNIEPSAPQPVSVAPTSDSTANNKTSAQLKVYTNSDLGFTLQIPVNLEIKNRISPDAEGTKVIDLSEPASGRTISIFAYKPIALLGNICDTLESEAGTESRPLDSKECQTVNGLQAVKAQSGVEHGNIYGLENPQPYEGQSYASINWLFMKNPKVLNAISLGYRVEGNDYLQQEKWFDDIIKTFEFNK